MFYPVRRVARALLFLAVLAALSLVGVGKAGAAPAGLCAYPSALPSPVGTTVTESVYVASVPCPLALQVIRKTATGSEVVAVVPLNPPALAPGYYTISATVPCGTDSETDLVLGDGSGLYVPGLDLRATAWHVPCPPPPPPAPTPPPTTPTSPPPAPTPTPTPPAPSPPPPAPAPTPPASPPAAPTPPAHPKPPAKPPKRPHGHPARPQPHPKPHPHPAPRHPRHFPCPTGAVFFKIGQHGHCGFRGEG